MFARVLIYFITVDPSVRLGSVWFPFGSLSVRFRSVRLGSVWASPLGALSQAFGALRVAARSQFGSAEFGSEREQREPGQSGRQRHCRVPKRRSGCGRRLLIRGRDVVASVLMVVCGLSGRRAAREGAGRGGRSVS